MQRQYLSIDIGGTTIKSARIDHSGNIMTKGKLMTPRSKDAFIQALQMIIRENPMITAICVSVPGIVDPQTGNVQFTGVLSYMGEFHLSEYLEKTTKLPVYVGNDANCATLAELWLGNLVGVDYGAVITLGTSVGGGIVINGKLLHGPHSRAGELSAMVTNRDNPDVEQRTVGATTSAVKMVEMITRAYNLSDLTDGRQAFQKISAHDPLAWKIFEEYCRRVAYLIINLQAVLDLEVVLIGGGISVQPILIKEIKTQFVKVQKSDRRLMADITMPIIKAANFGNEANLLGALYGLLLKIEN
ncbi:ROK family protein [Limosilactobacillus fastidiosus]|uniref:ROK family protein n=1 Tax=Limosilactobacillus fastidiosus TaxID=2759855 RepID=A0A7W3YC79_9LACO|nr:ROK family protein [Limosilactobacillus fastidiosus]MBB1063507.1 ROK family protein [Limosilactobacillus fastidiosus]MBB1085801.1 ROK family protein [Limosilactobacillus fastidiosus]MCD7084775.1 ROK family protein [Limosilactobacillus fastidiosus]MCD7085862.1 ROK family protein [Limosilactobacillus fastidiosus]MCD7113939.1 ROK family protein [Limosilactobacillus fastidiosus]